MTTKTTPATDGNPVAGWAYQGTDAPIVTAGAEHGKPFADLQAKLALKGHWLHALPDGSFMAGAWHYSRTLADLDAVRAFLSMVGGQP